MNSIVKELIEREVQAVTNIPATDDFFVAVDLIVERVHKMDGKLVTCGMGKAGQIAHNIATTFSSTGTPSIFLHPSEAQHGDLGVMQRNDILLLVSNSGKTREILELVQLTENLYSGIPIIVITAKIDSDLARVADVAIITGDPKELCPYGLTPSTSTTAMTVIGDVLVNLTMKQIKFSKQEYSKRHHGGYLGVISKQ